ncbi:hypothetical protein NL420_007495 [Escherichia coli]|nr:hypothetical protein [Escherichia coli]WCQ46998.1 hypothetical protein NL420_007495 [Escherichia coli]
MSVSQMAEVRLYTDYPILFKGLALKPLLMSMVAWRCLGFFPLGAPPPPFFCCCRGLFGGGLFFLAGGGALFDHGKWCRRMGWLASLAIRARRRAAAPYVFSLRSESANLLFIYV